MKTSKNEPVEYSIDTAFTEDDIVSLYESCQWSSAKKPQELHRALLGSHSVVSAWIGTRLVGLGNAISDGHLVVYYPHLLVHPDFRSRGIGREIVQRLQRIYDGFHQHMITADRDAIPFYEKQGFCRAGKTEPMWIYSGGDH